jgi:hypothetical protein
VEATVESYILQDRWHIVSAPVNSANSNVFYNIYLMYFTEPDFEWHFIEATNYDLTEGLGFFAWSDQSLSGNTTVSYTGLLNNGDLTVNTLSYTPAQPEAQRGWNLVGNPYPSYINWNDSWSRTNVDATIYVYDGANYLTWNGTDGTLPNGDVAPGQGFWVKANDAGASLTFPQSQRLHGTQQFYKEYETDRLMLTVEGNGFSDKMLIRFDDRATAEFDNEYDAWKFFGKEEAPQLYSILGTDGLTVNILPFENANMMIPVGLKTGVSNTYQLSFDDFDFHDDVRITLEDVKTGEMFEVNNGFVYGFSASATDDPHRFNLHFKNESFGTIDHVLSKPDIYAYDHHIYIRKPSDFDGVVTVFDIMGRKIVEKYARGEGLLTISVNVKPGNYIVSIRSEKYLKTQKVFIR